MRYKEIAEKIMKSMKAEPNAVTIETYTKHIALMVIIVCVLNMGWNCQIIIWNHKLWCTCVMK